MPTKSKFGVITKSLPNEKYFLSSTYEKEQTRLLILNNNLPFWIWILVFGQS